MKAILVICGSGVATSAIVMDRIQQWLQAESLETLVSVTHGSANFAEGYLSQFDIVVATTKVPETVNHEILNGIPLLSGVNADNTYQQLKTAISKQS